MRWWSLLVDFVYKLFEKKVQYVVDFLIHYWLTEYSWECLHFKQLGNSNLQDRWASYKFKAE